MSELFIRMRLTNPVRLTILLWCALAISACALSAASPEKLPYRAWELRFAHPVYMEVWVENMKVLDIEGKLNRNAGRGVGSFGDQGEVNAAGWKNSSGKVPVGGGAKPLTALNLPKNIFVRWQSLAEPQTYKAQFEFPEWAREKMIEPIQVDCSFGGEKIDYRRWVTLGLAPGGTVKVWIRNPCSDAIEVMTVQAEIEPNGPDTTDGSYYPITQPAKAYVKKHGIPYESWK